MPKPTVGLVLHPGISPFHFSVPFTVFDMALPEGRLFDVKITSPGARAQQAERAMTVQPDGGLELLDTADIVVVPGWHNLSEAPEPELVEALTRAHARGAHVVGLCYGAYALAYAGLLDGKKAATHWMAEHDFSQRFPRAKLDTNALYVQDGNLITSAGTGAGLDCCLHIVREYHGAQAANKVARLMVIPPHREGGQAQFIEQPVAVSTEDAQINRLLDYMREHLETPHTIDDLARRASMSRRTFTRHFQKATSMSVVEWLVNERLRRSRELLETTDLSVEEIAGMVGFQTATSLRQHFKQRHHVSPTSWRKTFGAERILPLRGASC